LEVAERNHQDMAAEGLITFEELGEKLLVLEDARKAADRELEALKGKRARITELEQDRDALLDSLIQIGSEALDTLTPDEKHQLYRILRLEVFKGRLYAGGQRCLRGRS
jgi:hypothetical protein